MMSEIVSKKRKVNIGEIKTYLIKKCKYERRI